MLYYGRCDSPIDLSEVTDVAKSNNSNESIVCHSWYFNNGFKIKNQFVIIAMI